MPSLKKNKNHMISINEIIFFIKNKNLLLLFMVIPPTFTPVYKCTTSRRILGYLAISSYLEEKYMFIDYFMNPESDFTSILIG